MKSFKHVSAKPIKSYSYQVSLLGTWFSLLPIAQSIDTSRCYLSGTLLHSFFSEKSVLDLVWKYPSFPQNESPTPINLSAVIFFSPSQCR